jgi:hypothetical protein
MNKVNSPLVGILIGGDSDWMVIGTPVAKNKTPTQ